MCVCVRVVCVFVCVCVCVSGQGFRKLLCLDVGLFSLDVFVTAYVLCIVTVHCAVH